MAIQGNGSNGYMTRATPGVNTGSMTFAAWVRTPASLPEYGAICYITQSGNLFALETHNNKIDASVYAGGWRGAAGTLTISANTWYHVAMVCDASTGITTYINGALDATDGGSYSGGTASAIDMGAWDRSDDWFGGRWAAVKLYAAVLSASEIAAEMTTVRPQRTANLAAWWPMVDVASAGYLADYSGAGMTLSTSGTLTAADGPPVGWGAPVLVYGQPAAGGATVEGAGVITVTSSVSGAGVVTVAGGGAVSASSIVTGAGALTIAGAGAVAAESTITATGTVTVGGAGVVEASSTISGAGILTVGGAGGISASSTVTGTGAITVAGAGTVEASSTVAGMGAITVGGAGLVSVTSAMAGAGVLTVSGAGVIAVVSTVTCTGTTGDEVAVDWLWAEVDAARLEGAHTAARLDIAHAAARLEITHAEEA